jgi:antitoxin MazE
MRSTLRSIGNSKGIILPQQLLKRCLIENEVNIEVKDNAIIITPANEKRKGWAEAFRAMAENGDDQLQIPDAFNDEDVSDWTWK